MQLYINYMRENSAIHTRTSSNLLEKIPAILNSIDSLEGDRKRRAVDRCYKTLFSARYSEKFSSDYYEFKKECQVYFNQLSKMRNILTPKKELYILRLKNAHRFIGYTVSVTIHRF